MTKLPRMMAGASWIDAHQEAKLLKIEEQIKDINVDHSFHSSWRTNTTFDDLCADIVNDATAKIGMTFLGGVNCSGLPDGVGNAELLVEVINSTVRGDKVLHFECYSANQSPYLWTKTYWKQTSSIVQTPWVGQPEVAPELSLGSDTKTLTNVVGETGGTLSVTLPNLVINNWYEYVAPYECKMTFKLGNDSYTSKALMVHAPNGNVEIGIGSAIFSLSIVCTKSYDETNKRMTLTAQKVDVIDHRDVANIGKYFRWVPATKAEKAEVKE